MQEILDKLNSAWNELQRKIVEVDKQKNEFVIAKKEQDEAEAGIKIKQEELNAREKKVSEIESIVAFSEEAKKRMTEAKALMANADERQSKLEAGLKKLAEEKKEFETYCQVQNDALKGQAKALREERETLNAQKKALKGLGVKLA